MLARRVDVRVLSALCDILERHAGILGRYPNIAYFVRSDPTRPSPPYQRGRHHSVGLGSIMYSHTKFPTATIRPFGDSSAGDKGMPFLTVIYGS
jgi:hypothetical protein